MVILSPAGLGPYTIPLATRQGTHIPNQQAPPRAPESLKEAFRIWKEKLPNGILRSAGGPHNCMGLAFASRRTQIECEDLDLILREDDYKQVKDRVRVQVGDVVIYRRDGKVTHVGIIVRCEVDFGRAEPKLTVLSKWGQDCEFIHAINEVPFLYGQPAEFWTDCEVLP
jgi:hypothetical protein